MRWTRPPSIYACRCFPGHRLSTIKRADRIVVLRAGAIIEQGTHERLLRAGGHYAKLYNAYFRHQSLEYIQTAPGST